MRDLVTEEQLGQAARVQERGNEREVGQVNEKVSELVSAPVISNLAWLLWSHLVWYLCLPIPAGWASLSVAPALSDVSCPSAEWWGFARLRSCSEDSEAVAWGVRIFVLMEWCGPFVVAWTVTCGGLLLQKDSTSLEPAVEAYHPEVGFLEVTPMRNRADLQVAVLSSA